ncbi:zinc-ribbon domain-containing protein [Bosea thiooxidans]
MLIVCPSCASQYELDAAKLGPGGRKVRCANCKTSWHVEPEAAFPEAPDAAETQALLEEELVRAAAIEAEISAVTAEADARIAAAEADAEIESDAEPVPLVAAPATRRQKLKRRAPASRSAAPARRSATLPAAAALAGLALLGLLVWQRNTVVRMAPQLADVFALAGLPVNVRGLSLSAVESGLVEDGSNRFLVVEGDVTNITRHKTSVPPIEVAVNDAAGTTLYTWTTQPPRPTLEPAELVRFRARLASPPEKGQSVRVRFTSVATAANIARTN